MGYYSEVAICMAFEDMEKRDVFWDLLSLRKDDVGDVIKNRCAKDDKLPWIRYHNDYIKWYESHPDRMAFEGEGNIFDLVIECGGAYKILRLGEEADDVEQDENEADMHKVQAPTDAFYMVRRIEWC